MANSSAKKLVKANAARLQTLRRIILVATVAHVGVRGALVRGALRTGDIVAAAVLTVIYGVSYGFLHASAQPTVENGRMVAAGEDISAAGVMEYVHDLIYVTVLVQLGCIASKFAMLGFLIVPAFAIYMFASSGASAPQADDGDAARQAELAGMSRKERRKLEREERKMR